MTRDAARDEEICQLYRDGSTQMEIAVQFGLSKAWVGQIVRRAGLKKEDRLGFKRVISTKSFTGVHLPTPVKEALRQECTKDNISISSFIEGVITKELLSRGVEFPTLTDNDPILPLESE